MESRGGGSPNFGPDALGGAVALAGACWHRAASAGRYLIVKSAFKEKLKH